MLEIKMDDGSIYYFPTDQYTEYNITKDYIVVKDEKSWIGVFDRKHFISLTIGRR